jgi:hypothetical protein
VLKRFLNCLPACLLGTPAFAQLPSVSTVTPGAAAPGKEVRWQFAGEQLANTTGLWTTFPLQAAVEAASTNAATLRVIVPGETPVGIGAVRLLTANGPSSPLLVMVDDLPSVAAWGTNTTRPTAQPLQLPVAIDGQLAALTAHYFRFAARRGDWLSVEVVAQRLGSALDPSLRLLDTAGRELAFNEDAPGLGVDARLRHQFAATGDYVVEVRDARYDGGPKHRYRLRLGDFPLLTLPFPPASPPAATVKLELPGLEAGQSGGQSLTIPPDARHLPVAARARKSNASGFTSLLVDASSQVIEGEPNDASAQAMPCVLPMTVNGRFERAGDRDRFAFEAKKGAKWWFTGQSRSIGSVAELFLRIENADGKIVAEANVTGAGEAGITNTFGADGVYHLVVEELTGRGGPDFVYRVAAQAYAGFALSTEVERLEVSPGGSVELKVTAARRDFTGPITLSLVTPGEGVALQGNVLPEKKDETTLKLAVPASEAGGRWLRLRLNGRGKAGDQEMAEEVSTRPAWRKLYPALPRPPAGLDGEIALWIKPTPPAR